MNTGHLVYNNTSMHSCMRHRPTRNAQFLLYNATTAQKVVTNFLNYMHTPGK